MKRIVLTARPPIEDATLTVEHDVPVPVPKRGEVLVKMVAAPVNPSDYGKLKNQRRTHPFSRCRWETKAAASSSPVAEASLPTVCRQAGRCGQPEETRRVVECVAGDDGSVRAVEMLPNVKDAASFASTRTRHTPSSTRCASAVQRASSTGAASTGADAHQVRERDRGDMTILHISGARNATTLRSWRGARAHQRRRRL